MEDGCLYPSIHMKIHGQRRLVIKNFQQTQAPNSNPAACGALAFFNGVLQSHLAPAHQGSSSPNVTRKPSSSRKRRSNAPAYRRIFWVTCDMATAPVNRVKLLMQCQNELIKSGRLSHPYKGIDDCFARTVRNEGIVSLWKGNTACMMGNITSKVIKRGMAHYFMDVFNHNREKDSLRKLLAKELAADTLSRGVTLLLVHPLQYAQTRMANDIITKSNIDKKQFNGLIDVFRKTLKSDGIAGVYRGYNISFVAWLVNDFLHFISKQYMLHKIHHSQHDKLTMIIQLPALHVFVNLITFPADTVIRRMMMRSGEAIKYKSSFDAFSQIIKNEGVKSLYTGASTQFIATSIMTGLLIIWPTILKKYRSYRTNQPAYSVDIQWKNGKDDGQSSH